MKSSALALARGIDDRFTWGARERTVRDVVRDGVVEDHNLLADPRDLPAQIVKRIVVERSAVEQHLPAAGLVETRNQTRQRGLAAAGAPDQRGDAARRTAQIDRMQCRFLRARIAETHAAKFEFAAAALDAQAAAVAFLLRVEHAEDVARGNDAALHVRLHRGQALERRQHHQHRRDQRHESTGTHLFQRSRPCREKDYQRQRARGDQLHECGGQRIRRGDLKIQMPDRVIGIGEAPRLIVAAAVDPDLALTGHHLIDHRGDRTHRILDAVADAPVAPANGVHDTGDERREHEQRKGQACAVVQHHADLADDHQTVEHHDLERVGARVGDLLDGVGHPGDLHARWFAHKVARGQREILAEHLIAQLLHHAARDARHAEIGGKRGDAAHQEQADDDQRHPEDRGRILAHEQFVEHRLDDQRECRPARSVEHHADCGNDRQRPVACGVAEQAAIGVPAGFVWRRSVHWLEPKITVRAERSLRSRRSRSIPPFQFGPSRRSPSSAK
jgi:hypothetical protein